MQLLAIIFLNVIQSTLYLASEECTSQPRITLPGRAYLYVALYPNSFDMDTYNSSWYEYARKWNISPTSKQYIGLVELFVCGDLEITRKSILYLLLDASFVDTVGRSKVISVGSHLSEELTMVVADMLLPFNILFNTYAKEMKRIDEEKYPRFTQFNVNNIGEKVVLILRKFHLNHIVFIALVRDQEDEYYKDVWFDLINDDLGLCVQRYNILLNDTERMKEVITLIKQNPEQRIIICYSSQHIYKKYFVNLVNISESLGLSGRSWIWNLHSPRATTFETLNIVDGGFIFSGQSTSFYNSSDINSMTSTSRELPVLLNRIPFIFIFSIAFSVFQTFGVTFNWGDNCYFTNNSSDRHIEYQVNESLWTACAKFEFHAIPDRFQWGAQSTVPPLTRCDKRICAAGHTQVLTVSSDTKMYGSKYWTCIPCPKGFVNPVSGKGDCVKCPGLNVSNKQRTRCYDPYRNRYLMYNSTHGKVILAASVAGTVSNVVIVTTFFLRRQTPIVRSSNLLLTAVQQSVHFILFVVTPVLFLGEPILIQCKFRHIVVGLLLTAICSSVFLKIQKLMFVFHSKIRLSDQEKVFAALTDVIWVLFLSLIQILSAVLSLVKDPAEVILSINEKTLVRQVSCNTGSHLNLQFLCSVIVMLIVVVQGLRAWKLPSFFNDTKLITLANFISVLMTGCMIPLYYSASDEREKVFLQTMLILCCNSILLFVMYGTKTYVVLFKPEKNTKTAFRIKMQEHSREKVDSTLNSKSVLNNTANRISVL
ncbi:metabotropic glutamate receptor 4-like [Hydractinia symbiolongicarpus]|uniref:metabotropic glutamate receptor 4-like n=1 Tax=Hydractinia symbiolongicarpus TaxID=13093 RepID=UPI002551C681|nr:metabotropic glutamate receptor 4-like [Hydractinia symbiolongicarpus]